jgi:hypothetical protein
MSQDAIITAAGLILAWFIREWWLSYKERHKKIEEKISAHDVRISGVVENFTAQVHALQLSIAGLTHQVQTLVRFGQQIPKIEKDLDALHSKVRELAK